MEDLLLAFITFFEMAMVALVVALPLAALLVLGFWLRKVFTVSKIKSEAEDARFQQERQFEQRIRDWEQESAQRLESDLERVKRSEANAAQIMAESQEQRQKMGNRYLNESLKFVLARVTPSNFATSKQKMEKAYAFVEKCGVEVSSVELEQCYQQIKEAFEAAVRKQAAKEEQRRIKEQIREEKKREAEIQRRLEEIEHQEEAIRRALKRAMARAKDEHDAEVVRLKEQLAEAEERAARTRSMAEMTKAGHVYVISNIGAFGEGLFKVGMTRRLEPMERVKELGDASVPFPFDVHMMISCEDAPTLETRLHRALHKKRVNRINLRKEFFRTSIDELVDLVEQNHGVVDYVAEPEALEYYESRNQDEDDFEFATDTLEKAGFGSSGEG